MVAAAVFNLLPASILSLARYTAELLRFVKKYKMAVATIIAIW